MSNNEGESSNCKPSTSHLKMEVDKKNSHSEIEKRRRDKMNQYINDLSTMIPLPPSVSKKPDKLTVLKYAVQHMKALQGSTEPLKETNHRPSFISDDDLRNLITEATSGFIIVIECDRGQVLYVSDSVKEILNISQENMVGFDFYELVHNKDVSVVKAQLSTTASDIKEDKSDAKKPSALKEVIENSGSLCPGAKRSFLCRMKMGAKIENVKNVATNTSIRKTKANVFVDDKNPILISYEGYLKSWPPKKEIKPNSDPNSCSCLVAVGRIPEIDTEQTDYSKLGQICEFETRQRADATFSRVDQSFVKIFGYLPEDVIGKSAYDFFHRDDLKTVAEAHYRVFHNYSQSRPEVIHRFRAKAGHFIPVKTTSVVFRNPWSKEVDHIATKSSIISSTSENISFNTMQASPDGSNQQDEMDENLRLLLFKLENLDNDESKSQRKRALNTGNGKREDSMVINHPSDIGVLLAEEAKKVGRKLRYTPQSAKYSNVDRPNETQQTSPGNPAVSPNGGNVLNGYREGYDVDDRRSEEENSPGHDGILVEQLAGIQGAIDAMENTGNNEDEEDSLALLMTVIQNEDLSNVLNDMPWNVIGE